MQLPGSDRAIVDPAKVREYLLNPEHPVGRGKARFFVSLGFRRTEWVRLQQVLAQLARAHEASIGERTPFGQKYRVRGIIQGPNGRQAIVETAWIILAGEDVPRLVTAFPGGPR